jgi:hypothetical protein
MQHVLVVPAVCMLAAFLHPLCMYCKHYITTYASLYWLPTLAWGCCLHTIATAVLFVSVIADVYPARHMQPSY